MYVNTVLEQSLHQKQIRVLELLAKMEALKAEIKLAREQRPEGWDRYRRQG